MPASAGKKKAVTFDRVNGAARALGAAARQRAVERCEALNEIAWLLARFETVEQTFDTALAVAARTLPLDSAILIEGEGDDRKLTHWSPEARSPAAALVAKAHAEATFAYLAGAPLDQVRTEHAGRTSLPRRAIDGPTPRFIVLPLVVANRPVFGALQMEAAAFDKLDLVFVNAMANQFAVALDRDRAWRRDIARREHAEVMEATLRAQAEDLVTADRQRSEFLSVLAEEIRVSLVAFREIQQLMRSATGDNRIDKGIASMSGQIQRLAALIDDLHGLSTMTREQAQVRKERVDVCGVVARAAEHGNERLGARDQTLTVTMCEPAYLDADAARLEHVFDTLIDKASMLASQGGRIWLTTRVIPSRNTESFLSGEAQVVVTLRDDGAGEVKAVLPRMIDLFSPVKPIDPTDARFESGLKLTRRIVELHGGVVCATTAGFGLGSEFEVRLPVTGREAEVIGPERRSS